MRCAVLCLTWLRPPVLAEHSIRPHHTLTVTKVDHVLYPGNVDPQLVGRAISRIVPVDSLTTIFGGTMTWRTRAPRAPQRGQRTGTTLHPPPSGRAGSA